jgi:serine/threonine protein kinase/tetratricopeptide (TPR) repeat protein
MRRFSINLDLKGAFRCSSNMTLPSGKTLGRYEVRSHLGTGGMGEVYLARDTILNRDVALKIVPAHLTDDPERMRRFKEEARTASGLNHPNIVTIHDILAVHEVDQAHTVHLIAMEFINGETLRQRLRASSIRIEESIKIAAEIADALSAAHAAHVVHRDIKPENVMLRLDGRVKVLDFGLAKLITPPTPVDTEATTDQQFRTQPGIVPGTLPYMSPEQAAGLPVDHRTDIFSLGVVIYEMVTGCRLFPGTTVTEVRSAILSHHEPPPLWHLVPNVPRDLERIVRKALRKNRDQRYQSVRDMQLDLDELHRELEVQREIERSTPPADPEPPQEGQTDSSSSDPDSSGSYEPVPLIAKPKRTSHLRTIQAQIRNHWLAAVVVLAVVVIAALAFYVAYRNRPSPVPRDTILIADFENKTGDDFFDQSLKDALTWYLQQTPFLTLFSEELQKEELVKIGPSDNLRVTEEIGRKIARSAKLKALITISVAQEQGRYVITLKVIDPESGAMIAPEQVAKASTKKEVLEVLGVAATKLRETLGEPQDSIRQYGVPLSVTFSNPEAMVLFFTATRRHSTGKYQEAIRYLEDATEKDHEFAYAHAAWAVACYNNDDPECAAREADIASRLAQQSGRVGRLEGFRIESFYYALNTGQIDKDLDVLERKWREEFPRDPRVHNGISDRYWHSGNFMKAKEAAQKAKQLAPHDANGYINLASAWMSLGEFDEAKGTVQEALAKKLDSTYFHMILYQLAAINQPKADVAMMDDQVSWGMKDKEGEYEARDWQAQWEASTGRWKDSQQHANDAIGIARGSNVPNAVDQHPGVAARYASEQALREVAFDSQGFQLPLKKLPVGTEIVKHIEEFQRNRVSLPRWALALALAGETDKAKALVSEMAEAYDKDTLLKDLWLPTIRAAIELQRGNSQEALNQLGIRVAGYEAAAEFWPQYLRGLAFLQMKNGPRAEAEFQKIIEHRGQAPLSVLYPLAYLGQARAAAMSGDKAKARASYDEFLKLWSKADPELPIFAEAKAEAAKLQTN